jgi:mannose-6-phosphate isomerase-like protein (cupin superfamily)
MTLWPGYYLGKMDYMPDPVLDEIPIVKMDLSIEPTGETKTTAGTYYTFGKQASLISANGFILTEQFGAGTTLVWWYPFDEFHYIVMGEADVTYSLASTDHKVERKMKIKTGDFFITPVGSKVSFTVSEAGPLRRVCGIMPGVAMNKVQYANLTREKSA